MQTLLAIPPHPPGLRLGPNDRYVIQKALGSGGFGITYLCEDRTRRTICVVKELAIRSISNRSANGFLSVEQTHQPVSERVREAFLQEARTLVAIGDRANSDYIVRCFEAWEQYGTAFYSMEYIENVGSLNVALRTTPADYQRDPTTLRKIQRSMEQLLDALTIVHAALACHGDVKPENVLVRPRPLAHSGASIVLIDFGTARTQEQFLRSKTVMATTAWAAPELLRSDRFSDVGAWSDLYAWGLMVYGFTCDLQGRSGIGAPWPIEAARRAVGPDPYRNAAHDLEACGLPAPWAAAAAACLSLDPRERPQTADAVRTMLAASPAWTRSGRTSVVPAPAPPPPPRLSLDANRLPHMPPVATRPIPAASPPPITPVQAEFQDVASRMNARLQSATSGPHAVGRVHALPAPPSTAYGATSPSITGPEPGVAKWRRVGAQVVNATLFLGIMQSVVASGATSDARVFMGFAFHGVILLAAGRSLGKLVFNIHVTHAASKRPISRPLALFRAAPFAVLFLCSQELAIFVGLVSTLFVLLAQPRLIDRLFSTEVIVANGPLRQLSA